MDLFSYIFVLATAWTFSAKYIHGQREHKTPKTSSCQDGGCFPATGNLLIGREANLTTNSTCGLAGPENYCIVSHLKSGSGSHVRTKRSDCFTCDSRSAYGRNSRQSHRIENIVNDRNSWWQARPGDNNVFIQLDLEAEFHFTHLVITFKTFRPAAMLVERSYDFGKTWKVYRYFADNCPQSFPSVPLHQPLNASIPYCMSKYSSPIPSSDGEVILKVLPPAEQIEDPYSEDVQNLLKMTNIRINFTKLHALGDDLFQESAKRNYYYAIKNMKVRGTCSCYGHASECGPAPGQSRIPNMVYGICKCNHHTAGNNCERCADFYNDSPWRPGLITEKNECKRCNCNNHATKCHFDPAVYMANNMVSGGVCDDCQHNTMGQLCNECKPHFYQNPYSTIDRPDACIECDCDPSGSENGGECDGRNDPGLDLVAGRCHCKRFVTGRRCDTCMPGFWNLNKDNPDGCEPCACNSVGTVEGYECHSGSGGCECKRFVTGRSCDQCMPDYWGLGSDPQGCKPCHCDAGSYSSQCDQRSGQCRCRPNVTGRHCNQLLPQHFFPLPDWLIYEAEFARGFGTTEVVSGERQTGQLITWTGPGYMKVTERSALEFRVDNIPYSMEYDLIFRYQSLLHQVWKDVRVTIERSGSFDQRGACANVIPNDDFKVINFHPNARYVVADRATCFEQGASYIIRLDFNDYGHRSQDVHLLVDSLVLLPGKSGHPLVQASIYDKFEEERCRESFLAAEHFPISDICRRLIFSSSVVMHEGAKACDCNPYGSLNPTCEPMGGQCQCRPGVYGRKCDQCVPGFFGLSANGCTPCNCHSFGSKSPICESNGQCHCNENSYGLKCGSCQRGYWGFPNCRRCECGGKANECNQETGACEGCRDNLGGVSCERCADGYYGDPRRGCQKCPCPGTNGMTNADSCSFNERTNQVVCNCRRGYTGPNCNQCADNHFGNPMMPGGRCEPCQCNNNIDPNSPGSCDPRNGECRRCLYNTEGGQCERCIRGYYGDALRRDCRPCVCNILGTRPEASDMCEPTTGRCRCLPQVGGKECDQCEPNFWNMSGGKGCEPCNCDPYGSLNQQCNQLDGQCKCRPDFGGRDCSQCGRNNWGDRRVQCQACRCNPLGSLSDDCDKHTGACHCKPGVTGYHCDRCAQGTSGSLPDCKPCGPCFEGWEQIIREISVELQTVMEQGRGIRRSGSGGKYERDFIEMEHRLEEIRHIIMTIDHSRPGSESLHLIRNLEEIRVNITNYKNLLNTLKSDLMLTSDQVQKVNDRIQNIHTRVKSLDALIYDLKRNATSIQEQDLTGAFNSIKESYRRSSEVQSRALHSRHIHSQSIMTRSNADRILAAKKADVDGNINRNEISIQDIHREIVSRERDFLAWNNMVCDSKGKTCDQICGGAGCGKCGVGLTCQDGSVSKSLAARNYSMKAKSLIEEKRSEVQRTLSQLEYQKQQCTSTRHVIERVHNTATVARNGSEGSLNRMNRLRYEIGQFLGGIVNRAEDIEKVVEMIFSMNINVTTEDIEILTSKINRLVPGLRNIDHILDVTRDTLQEVSHLKWQAEQAKSSAEGVRTTAQNINRLLDEAGRSQSSAEEMIRRLKMDIHDAENNFRKLDENIRETGLKSNYSETTVFDVRGRVGRLTQGYLKNAMDSNEAFQEAEAANALARETLEEAESIERMFNDRLNDVRIRGRELRAQRDRALSLKNRALTLADKVTGWSSFVQEWDKKFLARETLLRSITSQINVYSSEMQLLTKDIYDAERYLVYC